jgi:hypothetical protein
MREREKVQKVLYGKRIGKRYGLGYGSKANIASAKVNSAES